MNRRAYDVGLFIILIKKKAYKLNIYSFNFSGLAKNSSNNFHISKFENNIFIENLLKKIKADFAILRQQVS